MRAGSNPPTPLIVAESILGSPRFSAAITTASIGTAILAFAIRQTIGSVGLTAILATLVLLALVSLASQWANIGWRALMPISLLSFLTWAALSIFWSQYQWATLAGLAYFAAVTFLAVYAALVRDTIQIVRSFGDVFRFVLVVSIALEIFSGLLIDAPIRFLAITGRLDVLGPIEGLVGSRNQLGVVVVVALITFATEARTHSVPRSTAKWSIALASAMLLLTQSPVALGIAVMVAIATGILYALRRVPSGKRRYWQVTTLVLVSGVAAAVWAARSSVVTALNAGGELNFRLRIWQQVWDFVSSHNIEGWGWVGGWPREIFPFSAVVGSAGREPISTYNGFLDVWFQLGLVGLVIVVGFLGLTFVRSWLLASRRRSIVFAWPALVLVALILSGLAESILLVEFGWFAVVVCSVKAARELSWRNAFELARSEVTLPRDS
jgi:O-antigen ligase